MHDLELKELSDQLSNARVDVRLTALGRITAKSGGSVVRKVEDERTLVLLTKALGDPDRRVRRAAARGLRPWINERPELLDDVLPAYAAGSFDGSYTHLGLYDTRTRAIWIPRFAALRGHAALLRDGNTDWYFKFEFYVPGQVPGRLTNRTSSEREGHLVLHYVLDWSYERQSLIPELDERRRARALSEQARYAAAVIRFYGGCRLGYEVRVHRWVMQSGHRGRVEPDVAGVAARA